MTAGGGRSGRREDEERPPLAAHEANDVLAEVIAHYFAARPVNATFSGMHEHDHRLPDWSAAGVERLAAEMRAQRARIADATSGAALDDAIAARDMGGVDLALIDAFLDIQLAELQGRQFQRGNPSLVIGEAAFAIVSLLVRDFAPLPQRARMVRARLTQVPRFLATALAVIAEAPVPATWMEKALRECDGVRALLGPGLDTWCASPECPNDLRGAIRREADAALGAVEAFAAEVATLAPDATPARAVGEELLSLLIRRGHWCERSIDDLLAEVRDTLAAEQAQLAEMARAVDPSGLAAVQEQLAAAHPSSDEYYGAFARAWDACHALSTSHHLVTWPDAPIRYVPYPAATRLAAPSLYYLFYRSPAPLDWPALHDYVVPPIEGLSGEALERHLRTWNDSVIKLNHVVHHGALGHHVQNWYAARSPLQVGRLAAVDCASRIAMFLGGTMAEGWACYATDLMDEYGFLTPAEQVSEQHARVRMLARALVDLEFHSGHRTFEQAVALYAGTVGMPAAAAHAEAVKNSMFPGTALMYWLGTSQIHALRAREQSRLGAAFTMRDFHDRLLSFGSIPVSLAGRLMAVAVAS